MSDSTATRMNDAENSRRWLLTEGREGAPVHWPAQVIHEVDLTGASLAGAELLQTTFTTATLVATDLSRANAAGAVFDGVAATGARFVKVELTQASFIRTDLRGANLTKAVLGGANLTGANLGGAMLEHVHAVRCDLGNADLRGASLTGADLSAANLSSAAVANARFSETRVDVETRFDGIVDLDAALVDSIRVGPRTLEGNAARAWLTAQRQRERWTARDFQAWLLSKMSSPRVGETLPALGLDVATLRTAAEKLDAVFNTPGHAAAEYRRALGVPQARRLVPAQGAFAASTQDQFRIALWPELTFVVNEDANGTAWGAEFKGGPGELPANLDEVQPWHWTWDHLKSLALDATIEEHWTYDLEAVFTFSGVAHRYRARFDLGLLQSWDRET